MRRLALILLLVACKKAEQPSATEAPTTAAKPAAQATTANVGWVEADPAKPLDATIAEQTALAIKAGKKPVAYLHASWCPPCVEIEKTKSTPKMAAAFAPAHIIAIDVDAVDAKQIEAAGMKLVVLPIFYRLDDKGRPTGDSIDGGAWGDNIPDNMAPPLTAFFAK